MYAVKCPLTSCSDLSPCAAGPLDAALPTSRPTSLPSFQSSIRQHVHQSPFNDPLTLEMAVSCFHTVLSLGSSHPPWLRPSPAAPPAAPPLYSSSHWISTTPMLCGDVSITLWPTTRDSICATFLRRPVALPIGGSPAYSTLLNGRSFFSP